MEDATAGAAPTGHRPTGARFVRLHRKSIAQPTCCGNLAPAVVAIALTALLLDFLLLFGLPLVWRAAEIILDFTFFCKSAS